MRLLEGVEPYYETKRGAAYLGDAQELIKHLPDGYVNLIMTNPPIFVVHRPNMSLIQLGDYPAWFTPILKEFSRVLVEDGSIVLHVGGACPETLRSKLRKLLFETFPSNTDYYFTDTSEFPALEGEPPATLWKFSKSETYKVNSRREEEKLEWSSEDQYLEGCKRLGLDIPARYERLQITPYFFINLLTEVGDLVLDPFGGSNLTGYVAERLGRRWLSFEINEEHLRGSRFRFEEFSNG